MKLEIKSNIRKNGSLFPDKWKLRALNSSFAILLLILNSTKLIGK